MAATCLKVFYGGNDGGRKKVNVYKWDSKIYKARPLVHRSASKQQSKLARLAKSSFLINSVRRVQMALISDKAKQ